ncbi:hypothetical protein [Thiobacillus sp.]|uniref:hypothetical protein n=1 Tax=Thiobacillus sp. TaxID=924 RepID=UPI00286E8D6F|nr:hypothetical protein [Thiobacillus sp.]
MKVILNAVQMMAGGIFLLGLTGRAAHAAENVSGATLTVEASAALSNAEFLVGMAKSKKLLWTTAAGALTQAQEAAKKQDSEAVTRYSSVASEQAFLGLAQSGYPLTGAD